VTGLVPQLPALSERILLVELNHRINNDFASAINLVSVAAVRTDNAEVKSALSDVVELLHQQADVHRALKMPAQNTVIDAAEYLQRLCRSMSRSKLDRMGIKLVLAAGTVWLDSERCWQLGIIVHELVTNVARHAFFDGRDGEVLIELSRAGAFARCGVSDNGSTAAGARPGGGLKIIGDLAKSLGGQVDHSFGANGSLFTLALPFVGKEQQANRSRAAYHIESKRIEGLHHAQQ
jgi:two-component sensor histidine kinase